MVIVIIIFIIMINVIIIFIIMVTVIITIDVIEIVELFYLIVLNSTLTIQYNQKNNNKLVKKDSYSTHRQIYINLTFYSKKIPNNN